MVARALLRVPDPVLDPVPGRACALRWTPPRGPLPRFPPSSPCCNHALDVRRPDRAGRGPPQCSYAPATGRATGERRSFLCRLSFAVPRPGGPASAPSEFAALIRRTERTADPACRPDHPSHRAGVACPELPPRGPLRCCSALRTRINRCSTNTAHRSLFYVKHVKQIVYFIENFGLNSRELRNHCRVNCSPGRARPRRRRARGARARNAPAAASQGRPGGPG